MKHKLIKLISMLVVMALSSQQLAWAYPDYTYEVFNGLRPLAEGERDGVPAGSGGASKEDVEGPSFVYTPSFLVGPEEEAWQRLLAELFNYGADVNNLRQFVEMIEEDWSNTQSKPQVQAMLNLIGTTYGDTLSIIARYLISWPVERWLFILSSPWVFRAAHEFGLAVTVASGDKDPWEAVKQENRVVDPSGQQFTYTLEMPRIFYEGAQFSNIGDLVSGFADKAVPHLSLGRHLVVTIKQLKRLRERPAETAVFSFSDEDNYFAELQDELSSMPEVVIIYKGTYPSGIHYYQTLFRAPVAFLSQQSMRGLINQAFRQNFARMDLSKILNGQIRIWHNRISIEEHFSAKTDLNTLSREAVKAVQSALWQAKRLNLAAKEYGYTGLSFCLTAWEVPPHMAFYELGNPESRRIGSSWYSDEKGRWKETWDDEAWIFEKLLVKETDKGPYELYLRFPNVFTERRRLAQEGEVIRSIAERFAENLAKSHDMAGKRVTATIGIREGYEYLSGHIFSALKAPFSYSPEYNNSLPPTHSMPLLKISIGESAPIVIIPLFLLNDAELVGIISNLLEQGIYDINILRFFEQHYLNDEDFAKLKHSWKAMLKPDEGRARSVSQGATSQIEGSI